MIYRTSAAQIISIHALLAESDPSCQSSTDTPTNFNPRSPCGERPGGAIPDEETLQFQSTLSLRRATLVYNMHEHS